MMDGGLQDYPCTRAVSPYPKIGWVQFAVLPDGINIRHQFLSIFGPLSLTQTQILLLLYLCNLTVYTYAISV